MNIHDPARELGAKLRRKDLHVAGEDDQIGLHEAKDLGDLAEGRGLLVGINRHVTELSRPSRSTMGRRFFVIGNDGGDLEVQFAGMPPPEQIGEAVAELADHDDHFAPGFGGPNGPFRL